MLIDPLGVVRADLGPSAGVTVADADLSLVETVREMLPSLANRREDVFGPSESPAPWRPGKGSRATWKGAEDWAVAISSIVFTLTCEGMLAAQWIASAMSSAVIGCMPA